MADNPLQEVQTNRQDGGSQSSALVDRLARRFNDPIGVINVRYAEQKYERILGWLADRFGLIDRLRHRYDADEGLAGDWQTMVMQRSSEEQVNLFSASTQFMSPVGFAQSLDPDRTPLSPQAASSLAVNPPQPVTNSLMRPSDELTSTSEPKYRISRRRSVPSSSAVTSSTSSGTEPHARVEQVKPPVEIPRAIEVPLSNSTPPPFVFAKPITESLTESMKQSRTDTPRRFEPREGSHDAQTRSTTRSETSSQQTEVAAPHDSLPLARMWSGSLPASQIENAGARPSDEMAPDANHTNEKANKKANNKADKIAVASEVPDVRNAALSRAIPDIVWRNNRDAERMTSLAWGEQGRLTSTVYQTDNAAESAFAQQTNQPAASAANLRPPSQFQKDEIQIEQLSPQVIRTISERVMRAISLDLKVERERRGISKWR